MIKDIDFYTFEANEARVQTDREKAMFRDVWALILALGGEEKADAYLKRWDSEGLNLLYVYPGLGEEPPAGAEYLGEANDGSLYSVKP